MNTESDGTTSQTRRSSLASIIDPPIICASAPFDDLRGDIILRTSDNVDFQVFRIILDLASPVFKDMLSIPQPPPLQDEGTGGTPVVTISESSTAIDIILRFCYPIVQPQFDCDNMSIIAGVLHAATKYDIHAAIIPARAALRARAEESNENALAAYAIACSLKLEEEARAAAMAYLKWPALSVSVPELASLPALDYHNLLDFHRRVCKAVGSLLDQGDFLRDAFSTKGLISFSFLSHECSHETRIKFDRYASRYTYDWWSSSKLTFKDALNTTPLDFDKISLLAIAPNLENLSCVKCRDNIFRKWEETRSKLIAAIKEEVAKVSSSHRYAASQCNMQCLSSI
ncbi:hypothetical protein A7U60_g9040 [Sanghuangporus baumii]|uniref:BTB domain-containing protein n=1 Tax=Sanghuangporus baumii TaxID=108892 RepID=A0A9Q5MWZ4_SANBA|nr:hypothetical protein A7U60_g9040 [Sanghuangporus baumii]